MNTAASPLPMSKLLSLGIALRCKASAAAASWRLSLYTKESPGSSLQGIQPEANCQYKHPKPFISNPLSPETQGEAPKPLWSSDPFPPLVPDFSRLP